MSRFSERLGPPSGPHALLIRHGINIALQPPVFVDLVSQDWFI